MFKKYFIKSLLYISRFFYYYKKDNSLVLFGTISGKFTDNAKYMYLYLLHNQTQYTPIWVTEDKTTLSEMHSEQLPVVYKWSYKAFILTMKSAFFVYTHQHEDIYPVIGKYTTKLNLWHGSPLKKMGFDSDVDKVKINRRKKLHLPVPIQNQDYVIVAHECFISMFQSCMQINRSKILPLGLPRNDYLHEINRDKNKLLGIKTDILKKISLLENKKIILYAPTFRDDIELTQAFRKQINLFIDSFIENFKDKDIILLVRLHPYDSFKFKTCHNLVYDASVFTDMQKLLASSSMLITDYSSSMFDYSILNRPILLFIYDLEKYIKIRGGLYFDIEKDLPFITSKMVNSLILDIKTHLYRDDFLYSLMYNSKHNASQNILKFMEKL